jgi:hypothetical protein
MKTMGCGFFLMVLILAGIWGLSELQQNGFIARYDEAYQKAKFNAAIRERKEIATNQASDWVRHHFLEAELIGIGDKFDINGEHYQIGVMKGHNAFNATISNYCFFKLSENGIEEGFTDTDFIRLLRRVLHLSDDQTMRTLIMAGMDPAAYEKAFYRVTH